MSDDDDSSFERIEYREEGDDLEAPTSVGGSRFPNGEEKRHSVPSDAAHSDLPKKKKIVVELPPSMTQGRIVEAPLQEEISVKSCRSVGSKVSFSDSMIGKFRDLQTASIRKGNDDEENRINDSDPNINTKLPAVDSRKREPRWSMVDYSIHRRKRNNSDAASFSTWNTSVGECASVTEGWNDVASVAASSTISGFDLISVGGSKQHACPRCTFVNDSRLSVCDVCSFALQANPCLDMDALLAQQLQEQENRSAFKMVERDEAERQRLWQGESLLVQSQMFTQDILIYVEVDKNRRAARNATSTDLRKQDIVGYDVLPQHSMVFLSSRFIEEAVKQHKEGTGLQIFLQYHFLPKMNGFSLDRLRHDGFLPDSKFSVDADAALDAAMNALTYSFGANQSATLAPIPEDGDVDEETDLRRGIEYKEYRSRQRAALASEERFMGPFGSMEYLGCIAVMVKGQGSRDDWNVDNTTCITTITNPNQALPLVFFDATLRNRRGINRLCSGLWRVCNDFFDPLLVQDNDPLPNPSAGKPTLTRQQLVDRERRNAEIFCARLSGERNRMARLETAVNTGYWHPDAWMDAVAAPGTHTPERAASPMEDHDAASLLEEDLAQYFEGEQQRYGAKPN